MKYNQNIGAFPSIPSWIRGAIAGIAATGPMSIFMLATQPLLPKRQQYDLPPELLTKEMARRFHVRFRLNKTQIKVLTLLSHFGYGATMGVLYSPMEKRLPTPGMVKGMLFGLVIWTTSYLGLLPLLGLSETGQREPMRRNLLMIAAHIIWGTTLGLVMERLSSE